MSTMPAITCGPAASGAALTNAAGTGSGTTAVKASGSNSTSGSTTGTGTAADLSLSMFSKALSQYMSGQLGANTGSSSVSAEEVQGQTEEAGQDPAAELLQTLSELVKGNGKAQELLLGRGNAEASSDELNQELDSLSDLLSDGSSLDAMLAGNVSLLQQLQSWIQQAMQVLQGSQFSTQFSPVMEDASASLGFASLPQVAQDPETIAVALQDTLQLIKEQLNTSGKQATFDTKPFAKLISQLQSTLGQEPVQNKAHQQTAMPVEGEMANPDATMQSKPIAGVQAISGYTSETDDFQNKNTGQDNSNSQQNNGILTAGQLQLRDGTVAVMPIKVSSPVPVDRFADEMSGFVVSKLEIVKQQGMSEAKITLFPENLGQVDVKITLHNGQVVAQFVTEHATAKSSIEQQMAQLRNALQSQGLQVEKLEVTQNQTLSSHMYQDGRQSGGGSRQHQSNKRSQTAEEESLTAIDSLEEWNNWLSEVQSRQEGYGSSFTAKA